MKTESLHALVIDHHLGELSPEAAEMLAHFLELHPESRTEAERIRESLAITATTVQRHPELAFVTASPASPASVAKPRTVTLWQRPARAAAVAALALITGLSGFIAGRTSTSSSVTTNHSAIVPEQAPNSPAPSPWARYRLVANSTKGGMTVVRIDPTNNTSALQ